MSISPCALSHLNDLLAGRGRGYAWFGLDWLRADGLSSDGLATMVGADKSKIVVLVGALDGVAGRENSEEALIGVFGG